MEMELDRITRMSHNELLALTPMDGEPHPTYIEFICMFGNGQLFGNPDRLVVAECPEGRRIFINPTVLDDRPGSQGGEAECSGKC